MAHANIHDFDSGCRRTRLHANPPVPGRKNPEPDPPTPPDRDDDTAPSPDEDDSERHRPGRDERVVLRARAVCAGNGVRAAVMAAGQAAGPASAGHRPPNRRSA